MNTDTLWGGFIGGFAVAIAYLVGGLDQPFITWAIFMGVDYLTGILAGMKAGKISSKRAFWGLGKKVAMLFGIVIANQADLLGQVHEDTVNLRNALVLFFIGLEGISILENLEKLGVKMPRFVYERFEQMTGPAEEEKKKEDEQ